jgi:hypothetical protein
MRTADDQPEPARRRGIALVLGFLVLLSLTVLCVTAFLIVRVFFPESLSALVPASGGWSALLPDARDLPSAIPPVSTASGRAQITISPEQGTTNALIAVSGVGWLPGEPVFVFLRSSDDPQGRGYSYAAAVADNSGSFRTAFTFPNEARWIGKSSADVIAQGTRSGWQASRRFTLLAPTPTNTLLPTVRPTEQPTGTPQPTDTPAPTPTPTPEIIITDWRGEYFDNPGLSGIPALIRNDLAVSFDWGQGSPAPGLPPDRFSVRWTRQFAFRTGFYHLTVGADDGVRVWMDGYLILDDWRDGPFRSSSIDLELAGEHVLVVEYYESYGDARVQLGWMQVEPPTATPTPSPTATLTPTPEPTTVPSPTLTATPSPATDWLGEFYSNPELWGDPILVRTDPELTFDWGGGSPDPRLPVDHFSIRWTRQSWLAVGTYHVSVDVDDGVRVWVDGLPMLDEWHPSGGASYSWDVSLDEGLHDFRVEYFEDADNARIQFRMGPITSLP